MASKKDQEKNQAKDQAKDQIIRAYYRWYEDTYGKIIGLPALKDKKLGWLDTAVDNFSYRFSSIWRHEVLNTMKYYAIPKKTEYICSIFKISRLGTTSYKPVKGIQFHTTYTFLYSWLDEKNKITHDYVAICPTFSSADGEYRHRFITYNQFQDVYEQYSDILELVDTHILKQIKKKEVTFATEIIQPSNLTDNQIYSKLTNNLNEERLPIKFYTIAWIIDYMRYYNGILENHLIKGYPEAMFFHNDKKFYEDNEPLHDENITHAFSRFQKSSKQKMHVIEIGQKVIPITVKQLEEIGNIRHSLWCETYISSLVSNLVINGISPTFPIFNGWFLIRNSSKGLYDNQIMHFRLNNSEVASQVTKDLEQVRKSTYILDPIKKKEIYLSYNMEGLSSAIEVPMDYAEEEMVISKNTLCTLTEHVGRTMADQPKLIKSSEIDDNLGPIFTSKTVFAKYLFEYLYGIYTMNTKLGIIHSDLHLNNITIFIKRQIIDPETKQPIIKNPHILYNLEDALYLFPFYGKTSCIIDFSRAIVGPTFPYLNEFHNLVEILSVQRKKILHTYARELPEFHQEFNHLIQAALLENYELTFRVFTAVDAYKLCRGMLVLISNLNPGGDQKEIILLLNNIKDMAFNYLTITMSQVLKRQITKIEQVGWPLLHIITKNFSGWQAKPTEEITLIDYFSTTNELKYDVRNYDKFPPTVKFDYIIENSIPAEEAGLKNYHQYEKSAPKEEKIVNAIQETEIESKAERRGSPLRLASETNTKVSKDTIKEFKKELETLSSFYYDT